MERRAPITSCSAHKRPTGRIETRSSRADSGADVKGNRVCEPFDQKLTHNFTATEVLGHESGNKIISMPAFRRLRAAIAAKCWAIRTSRISVAAR